MSDESKPNGRGGPLGKLVPDKRPVMVGDVELELREPVLAKIDAAWQALDDEDLRDALAAVKEMLTSEQKRVTPPANAIPREDLERVEVMANAEPGAPSIPLAAAVEAGIVEVVKIPSKTIAGFMEENFDRIVTVLRKGLMPLLTKKLAGVIAIALDTRRNRLSLTVDCPEVCDVGDGKSSSLSVVSSVAFRAWVADELTTNQAVFVLEQISEVSGWADLGKRLWTLFAGSFQGTRPAIQPQVDSAMSQ